MWLQIKYREAGKRAASSCLFSKLPETLATRHAKEASQLQSQVTCSAHDINMANSGVSGHPEFQLFLSASQVKYKQEVAGSIYQQLPETAETQLAKELRGVYSQVRPSLPPMQSKMSTPACACLCDRSFCSQVTYQQDGKKEMERSLYSLLPETAETQLAKHASELQSEVWTLNSPRDQATFVLFRPCTKKRTQ